MYISREVRDILKEWKAESKFTHQCLYGQGNRNDEEYEHTLIIYTDHPGYFIGVGGTLHAKYAEKICKASYGEIKKVSYVETRGIF